jgi:hypothetical protein
MNDTESTKLRSMIATIDGELGALVAAPAGAISPAAILELRASWARLVGVLALGPEPAVTSCPVCRRTVMRAARLCGHCWTRLRPAMSNGA